MLSLVVTTFTNPRQRIYCLDIFSSEVFLTSLRYVSLEVTEFFYFSLLLMQPREIMLYMKHALARHLEKARLFSCKVNTAPSFHLLEKFFVKRLMQVCVVERPA